MQPVTGGIFTVTITHASTTTGSSPQGNQAATGVTETVLWDRKSEGGFPETKELKNRVRNIIEPGRDLGHIDRSLKKQQQVDQDGNKAVIDEKAQRPAASGAESQTESQLQNDSKASTVYNTGNEANSESKAECEDCK